MNADLSPVHLQRESEAAARFEVDSWLEPLDFENKNVAEPYPVDALPDPMRLAVEEVAGFVKAPIPLVAGSSIAALSLAAQGLCDVKRAEGLIGPISVFLLTLADSGERKSTCDALFMKPILAFERQSAEESISLLREHASRLEVWETKCAGLKGKIQASIKGGKPCSQWEEEFHRLQSERPERPKIPRLIYADATPEALAFGLTTNWPSAGIISSEGGIVVGGHAMSSDVIKRNLSQLCVLWDGGALPIDRRTSESFVVRDRRLTVAIQIQEPIFGEFIKQSGSVARGIGFMARCLVAWPKSTQGSRNFTEPPDCWPHLSKLHRRIDQLLRTALPEDQSGGLAPQVLTFDPETKQKWIEYYNYIEKELADDGELYEIRDIASKSADNAARLAALFYVLEGNTGDIGVTHFENAARIAAWHLLEAKRLFVNNGTPQRRDAERLDRWILKTCTEKRRLSIHKTNALQSGPLRTAAQLDLAIRDLTAMNRARVVDAGGRQVIEVNPALVNLEVRS